MTERKMIHGYKLPPRQILFPGDRIGYLEILGIAREETNRDGRAFDLVMDVKCQCGTKFRSAQRYMTGLRYDPNTRSCRGCADDEKMLRNF